MRHSVPIVVLIIMALALFGCGGGSSGKALAQETVKAIQAKDETKLKELGDRIDELSTIQKARFVAEIAQHGEEIGKVLEEALNFKFGQ